MTVLEYARPAPRARLLHAAMLVVAVCAFTLAAVLTLNPVLTEHEALGYGIAGTPFAPMSEETGDNNSVAWYLFSAAAYLALFLFTQWLFLLPRGGWRLGQGDEPLSRRTAFAAGFIGMLLSVGLLATLVEIPDWWLPLTAEEGPGSTQHFGLVWVVMLCFWALWAVVFHAYARSLDRYTALSRIFRRLLAGTLLELVVAAPVHAWVVHTRGEDCYCHRGTWTGVAFGCTAALWLFGPGAFLLFLREKRRRERLL